MHTPASNIEILQRASTMFQTARRQAMYQGEVEDPDKLVQDAEASVLFAKVSSWFSFLILLSYADFLSTMTMERGYKQWMMPTATNARRKSVPLPR